MPDLSDLYLGGGPEAYVQQQRNDLLATMTPEQIQHAIDDPRQYDASGLTGLRALIGKALSTLGQAGGMAAFGYGLGPALGAALGVSPAVGTALVNAGVGGFTGGAEGAITGGLGSYLGSQLGSTLTNVLGSGAGAFNPSDVAGAVGSFGSDVAGTVSPLIVTAGQGLGSTVGGALGAGAGSLVGGGGGGTEVSPVDVTAPQPVSPLSYLPVGSLPGADSDQFVPGLQQTAGYNNPFAQQQPGLVDTALDTIGQTVGQTAVDVGGALLNQPHGGGGTATGGGGGTGVVAGGGGGPTPGGLIDTVVGPTPAPPPPPPLVNTPGATGVGAAPGAGGSGAPGGGLSSIGGGGASAPAAISAPSEIKTEGSMAPDIYPWRKAAA